MKKVFLILSIAFFTFSCRSWTPLQMEYADDSVEPKLPCMQLYEGTEYNFEYVDETEFLLFRTEMERNIMTPYGDKFGSAFYSSRILEEKLGLGWWVVSTLSGYTVNLIGVPIHRGKRVLEVEVRIVDMQGRLLGKYIGYGSSSAVVALYWGYDFDSAYNKIMYESVNSALSEIREQIKADAPRLKKALLDSEKELIEIKDDK